MANEIHGKVVDDQGSPLSGATITLTGGASPQVQVTDTQGQFRFSELTPGVYQLSAASEGRVSSTRPDITIPAEEDTEIAIALNAVVAPPAAPNPIQEPAAAPPAAPGQAKAVVPLPANPIQAGNNGAAPPVGPGQVEEEGTASPNRDRRFFWLSVGQYAVLGLIGVLFVYFLIRGVIGEHGQNLEKLGDVKVARGLITYLVAVATVAIAMILVMASFLVGGKDLDKRFALGKEVLTLLIGILGTIIGFYYGSTEGTNPAGGNAAETKPAAIQIAPVKFIPEQPQIGKDKTFTLSTTVTGGVPQYTYSIKFDRDVIPAVVDQPSKDGKISQDFTIPANAQAGEVGLSIEIKDDKKSVFKDDKQKITLKAQ